MRRTITNSNLTKEFILSKISQVSIFSAYIGVDAEIIEHCIDTGEFISSPFRVDEHPSFGFRYDNRGKLKAKDFAGYFHGDCFDAAALVISEIIHKNVDISNKGWFIFILKHIAYTFRNIIYGKDKDENIEGIIAEGVNAARNRKPIIEFVPRQWNNYDKNYWGKFHVPISYLNTNFVYPVDYFYINRKVNPEPKYYYENDRKDVCYAYMLGQDKRGIYNIKLYFPNRKHGTIRFITNSNCLEGLLNLELNEYDSIIITKSTKDRISLRAYLDAIDLSISYGGTALRTIGLVNIPHESYKLKQNEYDWLRAKCPNGLILSLMDNDNTGYREAIWLRNNYNIIPLCIPREYEVKDFAELRSKYSIETIKELINLSYNYIADNYAENEFSWNTGESYSVPY
jgi:hypothetical protein